MPLVAEGLHMWKLADFIIWKTFSWANSVEALFHLISMCSSTECLTFKQWAAKAPLQKREQPRDENLLMQLEPHTVQEQQIVSLVVLTTLPLNIIECHSFICLQMRSQWHYTWECAHSVVCLWQRRQAYGLWTQFGPRAVEKPSYQCSAGWPRQCESVLSEAEPPVNKAGSTSSPLPAHQAVRPRDGESPCT